ncbi:MAG TPA: pantoate--beta-alanine ligase [Anaerolineales bacterium]|nr:pantoate--beta-alanine ligase [Anaerolineales bacterium]
MQTLTTLPDLRAALAPLPKPLGLIPTMGYLHAGHLSLVHTARMACETVVATIFVNPTQFGPNEDLAAYPRDMEGDLTKLRNEGTDVVWTPTKEDMYPSGFQTWVNVDELTQYLEGAMRPGHFRGVTTVVAKLFNAIRPDKAYFGQKDAQQVAVIKQMVRDLSYPLEIVVCPTMREFDGLAMSSRNAYLKGDERRAATVLYRALNAAKSAYKSGERSANTLRHLMADTLRAEPLAKMQYVSCAHPLTLKDLDWVEQDALFSMAVYVGRTRLIDNFLLEGGKWVTG